ncbi:hypothetical protein, partial [Streptomyces olivaceus]|uniref:hypothetical protein n=1 Tax=Streptomyces olivaceus TaxID=47716 RepID=UPI0040560DDA
MLSAASGSSVASGSSDTRRASGVSGSAAPVGSAVPVGSSNAGRAWCHGASELRGAEGDGSAAASSAG